MRKTISLLIPVIFILISCSEDDANASNTILDELLEIGQANSINRLVIDWDQTREDIYSVYRDRGEEEAIRSFLRALGDNHSTYRKSNGRVYFEGDLSCTSNGISLTNIPTDIGYVKVSTFSGSGEAETTFARQIQDQIALFNENGINKWIVDLSENGGGNMWPMIAGLGPLLGNNTLGYFIDPEGQEIEWAYENGKSTIGGFTRVEVDDPVPPMEDHKVAVVIDSYTASSGEATAISFVGRENTRFFGRSTCGLSTANSGFSLSNGDVLNLTVSTMADRNKNTFGGPVSADVAPNDLGNLKAAVLNWLNE